MHFSCVWVLLILFSSSNAVKLKRCISCRSRGEQGSCKDTLPTMSTTQEALEYGVEIVPCASGWCGKTIEGGGTFRDNDYAQATQRQCLQRGPSDEEERCAYTTFKTRKVYMCFCQGDLCNHASSLKLKTFLPILSIIISTITGYYFV